MRYTIRTTAAYRAIVTATRRAGVPLPTSLTDRFEHLANLGSGPLPSLDALTATVFAAMDAGRDPATDKAVREALISHQLGEARHWPEAVAEYVDDQMAQTLRAHAHDLLTQWGQSIGQAGATLAEVHPHLNTTRSLEESAASALRAGGTRASAWRTAADAIPKIDALASAWRQLANEVRLASFNTDGPLLVLAPDVDIDQARTVRTEHGKPKKVDAWTVGVKHGIEITGTDLPGYKAALARLNTQRKTAAAAAKPTQTSHNQITAIRLR